jgi:hypothetical protein
MTIFFRWDHRDTCCEAVNPPEDEVLAGGTRPATHGFKGLSIGGRRYREAPVRWIYIAAL